MDMTLNNKSPQKNQKTRRVSQPQKHPKIGISPTFSDSVVMAPPPTHASIGIKGTSRRGGASNASISAKERPLVSGTKKKTKMKPDNRNLKLRVLIRGTPILARRFYELGTQLPKSPCYIGFSCVQRLGGLVLLVNNCRSPGGVVIPLIFPKVPPSSLGIFGFPRYPLPFGHPKTSKNFLNFIPNLAPNLFLE